MDNYKKGKNFEEELTKDRIPIEGLPNEFLWMHVKGGTKVSNVVERAEKALESGEFRSIVWSGSGGGVAKTISCAEIIKRKFKVHQVTKIMYQICEEHWDPIALVGLDPIVVSRQIPAIHIFLTLDHVDPNSPGYQGAEAGTNFWPELADKRIDSDFNYTCKNKRSSKGRNSHKIQSHQKSNQLSSQTKDSSQTKVSKITGASSAQQ